MKRKGMTSAKIALFAFVLVSAVGVSPVCGAEHVQQISEPEDPHRGDSIPNEMQKEIIEAIKRSDLSYNERNELIDTLKDIWSGDSNLSDSEIDQILIQVSKLLLTSGDIQIRWTGYYPWDPSWNHMTLSDVHNDLARLAGSKMGISLTYQNILRDYASEPDTWFGDQVFHYKISGASTRAEERATWARDYIKNLGNPNEGYKQLSYSMHYMSDLSNPYHYAPIALLHHGDYENYVGNNWHSGKNYYSTVNNDWYYYYITDVSDAADNLANVCNQYFSYIDGKVGTYNWQNDATLVSYTRTCLVHGFRYDAGLINYATR